MVRSGTVASWQDLVGFGVAKANTDIVQRAGQLNTM